MKTILQLKKLLLISFLFYLNGNINIYAQSIGIIGSSVNGWYDDVDLITSDNINYHLINFHLLTGEAIFRQDNSWGINWRSSSFPTGIGTLNGSNIPIPEGTYNINFNRLTGAYSFVLQTIGCWKKVIPGKDATGGGYVIGLTNDGKLFSWGKNSKGQLGIGNYTNTTTPQQIGTSQDWKTFDVGSGNVIALKNNGTLWTWGSGESVGHGSSSNKTTPTQVGTANDWKDVYAGDYNVYAIKNNGTLWGTGRNAYSSLGIGNSTIQYNFIQIGIDSDWKEISGGNVFTVGLKVNGTLWTWGSDSIGQLGNGTSSNSDVAIPTQISNQNWNSIAAGKDHVIAIQSNGTLWAWGSNSFGQLGINSTTSKSLPVQVGTDSDWNKISAGSNHNSAMRTSTSGQIYVWGRNLYSSLGVGYDENTLQKIMVPYPLNTTNDWRDIGNGSFNSTAIKQNGDLYLWGRGSNGELGNGTNIYEQSTPITISCPTLLSINEINDYLTNVKIYPNPADNILFIDTIDNQIQKIEIFDLQGRLLKTINENKEKYQIDISNFSSATYLVKLSAEKGSQTVKVMKK